MPLTFADNVPKWLRRVCAREYKRLNRQAWQIHVEMIASKDTKPAGYLLTKNPYPISEMYLQESLVNDSHAARTVRHELLHSMTEKLQWRIKQSLPKKSPLTKLILQHLTDDVEDLIEQLVVTYE